MLDCMEIRQGMIFFVEDATSEKSVLFKGEDTPKKRRPWLVVSNNRHNMNNMSVSMCPIFTRSETKTPVQIYFKHGDRDQVIDCSKVTSVPKTMIYVNGYVGTLSDTIMKSVQKALSIQFSFLTEDYELDNMIVSTINNVMAGIDIKQIVMERMFSMFMKNTIPNSVNNNNYTEELSKFNYETQTERTSTNIEANINNYVNNEDDKTTETYENSKTEEITVIPPIPETPTRKKHKPHGKRMTLEEAMQFYMDTEKYSVADVYEKWKLYGVENNKTNIYKKKYVAKQRLIKEGLL